ncbi:hypothetical protein PXD04_10085 [Methanosphaera sp. ISO3-F5]|nr:hypothetical protein [Methanosphaera sp. ISO3-F5]WQH64038.1 hypothetical protein PXD04_10085 [Methanosphaera sp. ISO3-F5]
MHLEIKDNQTGEWVAIHTGAALTLIGTMITFLVTVQLYVI